MKRYLTSLLMLTASTAVMANPIVPTPSAARPATAMLLLSGATQVKVPQSMVAVAVAAATAPAAMVIGPGLLQGDGLQTSLATRAMDQSRLGAASAFGNQLAGITLLPASSGNDFGSAVIDAEGSDWRTLPGASKLTGLFAQHGARAVIITSLRRVSYEVWHRGARAYIGVAVEAVGRVALADGSLLPARGSRTNVDEPYNGQALSSPEGVARQATAIEGAFKSLAHSMVAAS